MLNNQEMEKLKSAWKLCWGEAPTHSLKDRRGNDVFDWWLAKISHILNEKAEAVEKLKVHKDDFYINGFNEAISAAVDIIKSGNKK